MWKCDYILFTCFCSSKLLSITNWNSHLNFFEINAQTKTTNIGTNATSNGTNSQWQIFIPTASDFSIWCQHFSWNFFFSTFYQIWFRTLSSLICLCIFNKRKIRRKIEEKFKIVLNSDSDFFPRTFYWILMPEDWQDFLGCLKLCTANIQSPLSCIP